MTTTGLQCPTCGHVHSVDRLAALGGGGRFECAGCSRLLAVPDTVDLPGAPAGADDGGPPTAAWPAPPRRGRLGPGSPGSNAPTASGAAVPQAARTQATPAQPQPSPPLGSPDPRLSAPLRAVVWLLALVVGFAASAGLLRAVGLLDADAVLDLFAGVGLGRYQLLLVLLPLWAGLAAGLAHLALESGARRRARKGYGGRRSPVASPPGQVRSGSRAEKRRAG